MCIFVLDFLIFLPIFLVAACTTCGGFDDYNGRRSYRWSRLFYKSPPVTELRVRVRHSNKNVAQFSLKRKLSLSRFRNEFFLKFFLKIRNYIHIYMCVCVCVCVSTTMTAKWLKTQDWFAKIWKPLRQEIGSYEDWRNLAIRKNVADFFGIESHIFHATCWQIFRLNNQKRL